MKPEASPTARALLALEWIQGTPGITADLLAEKLGVSQRAARRYVTVLREAGIAIEATRGRYGGYRVGRGVRFPPLMFSAEEALGLVMGVLDGHHDAGDPSTVVGSALAKIVRALPPPIAVQVDAFRRSAASAPDPSAARPDARRTATLVQACSQRRRVRIRYRTAAGSESLLEADPWAVVVRHGKWYLLCWSQAAQARRAYRVDRVLDVEQLGGTVVAPPVDLDPIAMLEQHLALGWEYEVDILIDAPTDTVARCVSRAIGRLEPVEEATTRLVGTTGNPTWYVEQLVTIPAPYRIVGCVELQEAARALGRRLLAAGRTDSESS